MPRPGGIYLVAAAVAVVLALLAATTPSVQDMLSWRTYLRATSAFTPFLSPSKPSQLSTGANMARRPPVYYLSHGGPSVMYNTDHPVYPVLQEIGREITQKVKPKAVVVFSAHWQGRPDTVLVNTAEITDLIYDFYGFPDHYYKAQYPNVGSTELANKVIGLLSDAGIKAQGTSRGLDHGVWAGFHVAFHPERNPLNVPIVQVSLFDSEDPDQHYRLGQAVAALRDEGVVVIGGGMSVHNLREMWAMVQDPSTPRPYAVSFDAALREAAEADPAERQARMRALCWRPDARQAHPTLEHLLPAHVVAGAAGDDAGKQLWTMAEANLGWAQYRFGDVPE